MVNGLSVAIVARRYIGHLKILNDRRVKNFSVQLVVIVPGKIRTAVAVKMRPTGLQDKQFIDNFLKDMVFRSAVCRVAIPTQEF